MKAIETQYKGCRFRSRLEARWAVFFDHLGIKWDYELEGFQFPDGSRYLPDFRLHMGSAGMWFEVKGRPPIESELHKAKLLADGTNLPLVMAWGTMDVPRTYRVGGKTVVDGAPMVQVLPDSFRPDQPPEAKAYMANVGLTLISAFYEEPDGTIVPDFLYVEDLPTVAEPAMRPVLKVGLNGEVIEGLNMGCGRAYRSPRLVAAHKAARSARFEFGESGGPGG